MHRDRSLRRTMSTIAVVAMLLSGIVTTSSADASEVSAEAADVTGSSKQARYIVVWDLAKSEPDIAAAGGKKERQWKNRVVASLPEPAVRKLAADPSVRYIQRLLEPGENRPHSGSVTGAASGKSVVATAIQATGTADWTIGNYVYDGSGNISRIGSDAFGYDTSGRLARSRVYANSVAFEESYGYDGFGNLNCKGPGANCPTGSAIPVDIATNRLSGRTYDVGGRLTNDGVYSMTWDADGMMRQLLAGSSESAHVYDASGERIGKTDMSIWHWTIRDPSGRVVREYESAYSGAWEWLWVEDRIYRDGQPLAVEREAAEGGVWHQHTDHLGSVRMVTNQTGQQISRHVYAPFGTELTSMRQAVVRGFDEQSQRFTGHERDFNGGTMVENQNQLDYMHARYYSPVLGRFLSVDPSMDLKANLPNPQRWNRYSYVSNNPINKTDPDGRDEYAMDQRLSGIEDDWEGRDRRAVGVMVGVASLFTPGPEDLVMGAFLGKSGARFLLRQFATKIDDLIESSKLLKSGKSIIRESAGDFGTANKEFDRLTRGVKVTDQGKGVRSATLPDGTRVSVRPKSKSDQPTIQINKADEKAIKIRFKDVQ
jgi:RHS repeat-associated protein